MYVPSSFQEDDPRALHALVQANGCGRLVTVEDGLPHATHLPMLLDRGRGLHGALFGHLARANPRWRTFDGKSPALAVLRVIGSREAVRDLLGQTMTFYESALPEPRSLDSIPADYAERLLGTIVGFELPMVHIAGARKLSQNKGPIDRARVVEGLRATGDAAAARVAALVQETIGAAGALESAP